MTKQFKHCTFNITVQPEVPRGTMPHDIPNNTVTTKYHDEIVLAAKAEGQKLADELRKYNVHQGKTITDLQACLAKEKSRRVTSTKINNELHEKVNRLGNRNRELADEAVSLKRDVDRLDAVANRLRRERDELLDAATKPTPKTVQNNGGSEPAYIRGTEHVGHPDIEVPKKRQPNAMRTREEVWAIRRYVAMERGDAWIAKQLNLPNPQAVYKIRRGLSYANVPAEPKRKPVTVVAGKGEVSNG